MREIPGEFEVERYELREGPAYTFVPDRRDFFKVLGGGLVVALVLNAQESGGGRRGGRGGAMPRELGAWIHIDESGGIMVYSGKTEVGQNVRTSLTLAVAEELRVDPARVELVLADTDRVPYDAGTFGSQSTPQMAPQMRKVAAAAREMLVDLAAQKWNVSRETVRVENGQVHATGKSVSFGELTRGQKMTRAIEVDAKAGPPQGKDLLKVNARDMVTGKHRFTTDVRREGMWYGRVLRPAAFNAKLASVNTDAAARMDGVAVVHDGNFVAVACADPGKLGDACAAIQADWKSEPQISALELFSHLRPAPAKDPPPLVGDAKVEATYTIAYIAHVPLEPRAAVAEWAGDKLTVWTGTQRPFGVRSELAKGTVFRISIEPTP